MVCLHLKYHWTDCFDISCMLWREHYGLHFKWFLHFRYIWAPLILNPHVHLWWRWWSVISTNDSFPLTWSAYIQTVFISSNLPPFFASFCSVLTPRFSRHSTPQASLLWYETGCFCRCQTSLKEPQWPWPCGASPVSSSLLPRPSGSRPCILSWHVSREQDGDSLMESFGCWDVAAGWRCTAFFFKVNSSLFNQTFN